MNKTIICDGVGYADHDSVFAINQTRTFHVSNNDERFTLITKYAKTGDIVEVSDSGNKYLIIDASKLNSEEGYKIIKGGLL